ncbi:MAG: orotate phosphoribosyltransferase [Clostridiales bacterium]|jgi:orotate phosphoribosyltransferase|nr:orotate phosphoribosyltransferase [Clostridiales bacterium]
MGYKESFIELMVESGVLTFGEFITKSGRKSPYFINTGNYRTGAQISKLGDYYARCIAASGEEFDCLYGPAYKGIPLAVAASISLYNNFGKGIYYSFNRKEKKDHGEGGTIVGYVPKDGDRIAIIEDVVTAGTAVRETMQLFASMAGVKITALYVSCDRMERGKGSLSALDELEMEYGIRVYPIVTIREVINYLSENDVNGKRYLDKNLLARVESYLEKYGAER